MLKAAPQRSRQLAPGDKLGKYEVIRQIAIGGMAELYLARTLGIEGFEKLVVLKRILPQYVTNTSFVNMFLNEARIAATLHHPNVAQVYDIGLEDGDYFFAMEYVHGEDLDHMSKASEEQGVPVSMDAALTLVAGLCAGLHYAHDKANADGKPLGIVHRDVSPSNVLVSYDGAVKLVDFGIARASSRPGTTQGGLKGKIAYMSPEQCKAKADIDRRSDIYSVGTLLYELTTGRLPFSGETEYQVLSQIVNDDVPAPSTVVPGYPPQLEKIVMRALTRDAESRYPTALELQSAIEDFAHETRLRISPLVLARLMGTLFPARLEEWDHAKAQGAFFVEQHVVRTLIESGKTPDRSDPTQQALVQQALARQAAAEQAAQAAFRASAADDDPTTVSQALTDLGGDTSVGPPPLSTDGPTRVDAAPLALPLPSPPTAPIPQTPRSPGRPGTPPPSPPRPSTPGGGTPRPQSYPVVALSPQHGGTLVSPATMSAAAAVQATPGTIDVTERVRVPSRRQSTPTTFVRTTGEQRSKSLLIIGGLVLVAGGIAAVIAFRGGNAKPLAVENNVVAMEQEQPSEAPSPSPEDEKAAEAKAAADAKATKEAAAKEAAEAKAAKIAEEKAAAKAAAEEKAAEGKAAKAAKLAEEKAAAKAAAEAKAEARAAKLADDKAAAKAAAEAKAAKLADDKAAAKAAAEAKAAKLAEAKRIAAAKAKAEKKPKAEPNPEPKPQPKPEPKEEKPSWNADSPFMPVRPK